MFKRMDKPLKVGGDAVHVGMSRNRNLYTDEELHKFAPSLAGRPIYIEHVSSGNAVGEVTRSWYDSTTQAVKYEGNIWDQSTADQLKLGLIKNVSICADYEAVDLEEVKIPHNLSADHLGLVAVPGVPGANINILEHLLHEGLIMESAQHREIRATIRITESSDIIKKEETIIQYPREVAPLVMKEKITEDKPKLVRDVFTLSRRRHKTPAQRWLEENVAKNR